MLRLERWIPWHAEASLDERFRAEMVIGGAAFFVVLGAVFAVETFVDPNASALTTAFCIVGSLTFAVHFALVRRRSWFQAAPLLLTAQLVLLISISSVLTGGYRNYSTAWPILVPLIATYLVGVQSGAICAALMFLEGLGLWWLEDSGRFIPHNTAVMSATTALASAGGMFFTIVGIGVLYERAHAARLRVLSTTLEQLRATHLELTEAQKKLVVSERLSSLGLLAAGVAHEINNPMAYITSNVASLSRDLETMLTDASLRQEYVEDVLPSTLDGIRRVNAIVSDLRRFARGDPDSYVEYDLNEEIAAALRMSHCELERHHARTDLDLAPLPKVLGLPRQIMQVVMNLVINAAHACGSGGLVRISSWAQGEEVMVKVQDSGIGMSPETLSKLFQPFFTTKPVGQGTGLGLSVAHGIVAAHGGRIEVASSPGTGSAFTLFLPLSPPLRAEPAAAQA
ncbi:MAG: hypothetical protein K1X89_12385 [Myxococcaceae bacterium]|nr:hypothetical protein [Myxococcaceae bacterium]